MSAKKGKRPKPDAQRRFVFRTIILDRDGDQCSARFVGWCTGRAEQLHHLVERQSGGVDAVENLIMCCGTCHGWIHRFEARAAAMGMGLSVNPKAKPMLPESDLALIFKRCRRQNVDALRMWAADNEWRKAKEELVAA